MKINLNGKKINVKEGKTIFEICRDNKIIIPTLCRQESSKPEARCRVCVVEMNEKLVTSCSTYPTEGCLIITHSKKAKDARRMNVELVMQGHQKEGKILSTTKELKKVLKEVGLTETRFTKEHKYELMKGNCVIFDNNKCIKCGRCINTCADIQGINAIEFSGRGYNSHVSAYSEKSLTNVSCIKCGQCIMNCPVAAINEKNEVKKIVDVLKKKDKHIIIQIAPSVRSSIGEEFGQKPGLVVTDKLVAALKKCGFDKVYDIDLGADFTIMEEATEFLNRIKNNGPFPMITSCCPAWVLLAESFYPNLIKHLSSAKSPTEMLSSVTKTYYAEKYGINKKDIIIVASMPCTAKKFEAKRKELKNNVDYVLTTRETAQLIKHFNIDLMKIKGRDFDPALGISTGAGDIFGATGGVMEAALRTAYELGTGKTLTNPNMRMVRGMEGIKKGEIELNGKKYKLAVVSGGRNAQELLKDYKDYHFIEVMACPGGCVGGGGQPIPSTLEIVRKRAEGLYNIDAKKTLRKSHENPILKKVYKEYMGTPGGKKAKRLLHTTFQKRSEF